MNIVVLAGGTSAERDVSIMTSMMVCGSLRRNGHHANMIDVFTGSGKYKHSSEFFQEESQSGYISASGKNSQPVLQSWLKKENASAADFSDRVYSNCVRQQISFISDCTVRTAKTVRFRLRLI